MIQDIDSIELFRNLALFREIGFLAFAASPSATQTRGCWVPDQVRQEGWWWRVFHNLALFREMAFLRVWVYFGNLVSGVCCFIFRHADAWLLDAGSSPAGGLVGVFHNLALFRETAVLRVWLCFGNPDFRRSLLHLSPRRRVAAGCRITSGRRGGGGGCFTIWLCFGKWLFRVFGFVSGIRVFRRQGPGRSRVSLHVL